MIVWLYGGVNGSEIEVQPIFNNVATSIDRDSDILGREIQKRASGIVKQPIATNIGAQLQVPPRKIAQPAIGGHPSIDGKVIGRADVQADFNPALFRGYRGPGIKIRINRRSFQYASTLASQILNREIVRFQIPDVNERIEEACGEVTVCNIYVSNYRPPECLNIYPSPPNHIVLNIEDLDIGVTGNLDGIIRIIFPIQLFGIVHANFYHVSATISLNLIRSIYGTPQLVVSGCDIKIPYVDVCIQNGGLVGQIANFFFRQDIAGQVRSIAPGRICAMLPQIINERINPILLRIPRSIPFTQIADLFTGFLAGSIPPHCRSPRCQARLATTNISRTNIMPPRNPPSPPVFQQQQQQTSPATVSANGVPRVAAFAPTQALAQQVQIKFPTNNNKVQGEKMQSFNNDNGKITDNGISAIRGSDKLAAGNHAQYFNQSFKMAPSSVPHSFIKRIKQEMENFNNLPSMMRNDIMDWSRTVQSSFVQHQPQQTVILHLPPKELYQWQQHQQQLQQQQMQKSIPTLPFHPPSFLERNLKRISTPAHYGRISSGQFNRTALAVRNVPVPAPLTKGYDRIAGNYKSDGINQPINAVVGFKSIASDPCAGCPPPDANDLFGDLGNLIKQQLDLRKVGNLVLTVQLLHSYATYNDYNIDLTGEFSPNGRGGTPFSPFPMQWPTSIGSPMIEILISDFTINSLLYWMHRANFLSFRIGPETPSIGSLLVTTCDISNDYSGEDFENEALFIRLLRLSQRRRRYHLYHQQRSKRQAITGSDLGSLGDLADLGICLGDIIPAIKEKYPNRTLALLIHTSRAPSIAISRRGGGNVQLDLIADVNIYLDKTNIRVGTMTVIAVADIMLRIMGQQIVANASLPVFRLMDRDQTLGLQQDALDNLASLASDMILKVANQQLNRGLRISLPTSTLPLNIINPHIQILDHSIYIGSDFTVSPSVILS